MWKLTLLAIVACASTMASAEVEPIKSGDQLVARVLSTCGDMDCVKENVLAYLDNLLNVQEESARSAQNIDSAIYKRVGKILKTHEFRFRLPEAIFDATEVVYNPRSGLDLASFDTEARGMLKKKLLLPVLLLLKLKMKALMPIFVALVGLKAFKALVLSKLAIAIVLGFVIYQLCTKAGMAMPMMMSPAPPAEPPAPMYGPPPSPPMTMYGAPASAPMPTTSPPSSYDPGWEPSSQGGPYSRVWTAGGDSQNLAYSAYYPGAAASSSTTRPQTY